MLCREGTWNNGAAAAKAGSSILHGSRLGSTSEEDAQFHLLVCPGVLECICTRALPGDYDTRLAGGLLCMLCSAFPRSAENRVREGPL